MKCIVVVENPRRPDSYLARYGFTSLESEAVVFSDPPDVVVRAMDVVNHLHCEDVMTLKYIEDDVPDPAVVVEPEIPATDPVGVVSEPPVEAAPDHASDVESRTLVSA